MFGIALAGLCAAPLARTAQEPNSIAEYDVKAVFLYHFTRYLQWPENIEAGVFTIAVLGESGIVAPLQEIARKKTVGAIPLVVRTCSEIGQIGRPRILFVARSALAKINQVLEKTRSTDILTVGEAEGLAARGVAINFVLREGTVKFEMNEKTLREARIQIGSQLLKLAIRVAGDKGKGG
jgi:hypothetical protein